MPAMAQTDEPFNAAELVQIRSLFATQPTPRQSGNRLSGDARAIAFGRALFFSDALSNPARPVSCATCHRPDRDWTDGRQVASGGRRNVPTLWGVSHGSWFFWDGRADSVWGQATQVLESPDEHDIARTAAVQAALSDAEFAAPLRSLYGDEFDTRELMALPGCASPKATDPACRTAWQNAVPAPTKDLVNRLFVVLAKSIAAYVETLQLPDNTFDQALASNDPARVNALFTPEQRHGLRVFIGRGGCAACHFGNRLTDGEFHDVRVPPLSGPVEPGRHDGVKQLRSNEFNMLSAYADDASGMIATRFVAQNPADWARFKTPTLRRVAHTGPYMHQGQFATLEAVIDFYSSFQDALPTKHHADSFLLPRNFTAEEKKALLAFLRTL